MGEAVGVREWVIAEGYIPSESQGPRPQMLSHETVCLLNTGDMDAHVEITIYSKDRQPAGPYDLTVSAPRRLELDDPEPINRFCATPIFPLSFVLTCHSWRNTLALTRVRRRILAEHERS
jgi:hypothetical protein